MSGSEADYVVIRDPDLGIRSGWWYDRAQMLRAVEVMAPGRVYTPTPFIEVRSDGVVAQIYMPARTPPASNPTPDGPPEAA